MSQSNSHSFLATDLSPEVLALLAASYGRNADKVLETIVTRSENPKPRKASKLAAVKAQAVEAAEQEANESRTNDPRPAVVVIELPSAGTLDARSFLIAMRRATARDESIKAIAGYCGFDRYGDYGTQDLSARMMAQRAIRGCKAAPLPIHSAAPSGKGYVSGMPDAQATHLANLQGRAALTAEQMCDYQRQARESLEAGNQADAHYYGQLALVEQGRLNQIKSDLASL